MNRGATRGQGWILFFLLGALGASCSARTLRVVEPCPPRDAAQTFVSCQTLEQGLIAHWGFEDGTGSSLARDSSPYGNHGALRMLDPATAWVEGRVGAGALGTEGVGYASVDRSPSLDSIVHNVSLAAWLYLEGPIAVYATVASRQIGTTLAQYYHIALNRDARPSLFINPTFPANQMLQLLGPANQPVPPQRWTHIAGTYDGARARLYVDGVLITSGVVSGDFDLDLNPFILGGNGNEGIISERFSGRIDEVVLYNRALDDREVAQLADAASPP